MFKHRWFRYLLTSIACALVDIIFSITSHHPQPLSLTLIVIPLTVLILYVIHGLKLLALNVVNWLDYHLPK
ncbi:hypothetical protein [Lactiplantibacillus mudanjiangensis]|uniref:Uncharacterized protein n=1 Tax=Lactiplantibacillus mudanjiangensis TaxID=1296538 RepID=A0A660E509_9LACO|nr:hypothetical protein [Lactiplantibacillus mudanjiangensis]VDG21140.1 hypothetical protein MUDAN_BIHEEGNE_02772 [Lactiplantibacillus mudanjiangensis]VDG22923.1 hypothetical protein MUDAN_IGPPGNFN_00460 [Lactiplantibacillus mudanjiangensis]VDG29217.1 hypothetical protein MUDAN_MDHGFNIF_00898 [Lactiplantibacillus mudanjiangensis]VDG31744.1 hypothetical protein MUDAN_DOGOELCO_01034 [Lactiplantibacillus mudanjiangensis]